MRLRCQWTLRFGLKRGAPHMPFRFGLRPRSPSEGVRGGLQLALDRSDEPCDSSIFRGRDAIEPVSAIEPIIPCSPTCPFSPRDSIPKCRARCPRSAFEPARAPPVARERDEECRGFTPHHPPGRAFSFADMLRTLSFRNVPAGEALDPSSPATFASGLDRFRVAP